MAKIDSLNQFGQHIDHLTQSLNLTKERSNHLLKNIAHANVAGYQREDSDFVLHLDGIGSKSTKFTSHKDDIMSVAGTGDQAIRLDGSTVDLERETVLLNQTEVRYTTLTELVKRDFSRLRLAIREGK